MENGKEEKNVVDERLKKIGTAIRSGIEIVGAVS